MYDANGTKLKKVTSAGSTKHYINGIEYDGTTIEAIYHAEGRASLQGSAYRYEYTLRDHLGNTRVTFADLNSDGSVDETEILQQNHYYPFGMNIEGAWSGGTDKYQYNGKELNGDFGLDWNFMPYRTYDPALARWGQVDLLAEFAFSWSPYSFGFNNPVAFSDPLGLFGEYSANGEAVGADGLTNSQWLASSNPLGGNLAAGYIENNRAFAKAQGMFCGNVADKTNDPFLKYGGEEAGRSLEDGMIHIYYPGILFSASETSKLPWMNMATGLAGTMDGASDPIFTIITLGQSMNLKWPSLGDLLLIPECNGATFFCGIAPRVPKGSAFYNPETGIWQFGGTMVKKGVEYVKVVL